MNKLFTAFLLLFIPFSAVHSNYYEYIDGIREELVLKKNINMGEGYFPHDCENFIREQAPAMMVGERLYLAFYPKQCGFDSLCEDASAFVDTKKFFSLVKQEGFKVISFAPHRHLASFENLEELNDFTLQFFQTPLKENVSITRFLTKVMVVELEKIG